MSENEIFDKKSELISENKIITEGEVRSFGFIN
jgi:hypothetical protein